MSNFKIKLSYKNIKILKHSLEQRIARDNGLYEALKGSELTEQVIKSIKEHEEHLKCLDTLVEQMECTGYKHGKNVFGSKYE